jgi:serine/threonine-protein kinase
VEQAGTSRGNRPHAGLALGSSRIEQQATAYLQRRLLILARVITVAAASLYVVFRALNLLWMRPYEEWSDCFLIPSTVVHLASVVLAGVFWYMLRRRSYGEKTLRVIDALLLYLTAGTCVAIYALEYMHGIASMEAILSVFLVARAVVVPSSARCTILLSLPAPIGMLAVQLAHGAYYPIEDVAVTGPEFAIGIVVVGQVVLLLAVGIEAVASAVNFSLRIEAAEARRLGQYRLEERIGSGSMGEVYRATHAMLRRPTAIKLLRSEQDGEETIARFEREVRMTSRLSHPNTVLVYDYGRTDDGRFYYAMEYLDGADLKEIVGTTGPMPASRVIWILQQACASLAEAHLQGLVHRDIKPGNLVLCARGGAEDILKVVDFGLVKDIRQTDASLTQLGNLCGTPETMAPEVLSGAEVSASADLYALSVVGYYLLTGVPAFEAKTIPEFIAAHLGDEPRALVDRDASIPDDLAAVIHAGLAKSPQGRPASAAEYRRRLLACAAAHDWTQDDAVAWWEEYRREHLSTTTLRREELDPASSPGRAAPSRRDAPR